MAEFEKIWEKSIPAEHGGVTYTASIRVRLHGKWSGQKTTGTPQVQSDRTFKLKITGSYTRATVPEQSGEMWTSEEWYCFQNDPNSDGDIIYAICIDELYNKWVGNDTDGNLYLPFLRRARHLATNSEDAEYYVACEEITEIGSYPGTATDLILQYIAMAQTADMCLTSARINPTAGLQWCYNLEYDVETDLPIFNTEAQLMNYINSDGEDTSDIANVDGDPEEEYNEQFDYWYIKNKWGHNTRNTLGLTITSNYRFYPKRKGICFVEHTPTAAEPYDRILVNYDGYTWKFAPWGSTDDEDFIDDPDGHTTFLTKNISFGANDYYTKFAFDTNIPKWSTMQDADDYLHGLKDITEADNYAYISRQDASILNPDLPGTDIDESTSLGTNGMRYSYGNRLYEMSNIELASLMTELYTPANFQSIIDGNKLFGSNTMEAVSGIIYIPLTDLSEICSLGSLANIKIGAWESQSAQGKRITDNEGTIDCGSFFYNPIYYDFRDYEPYNLLFANLPFCGMHQLTISKYLNKTVGCTYNIDVCTGAIVCKLTADNILVDVFEGTCGASRPLSATDNNAYINNIVGSITGASANASGSIEGITNSVSQIGGAMGAGGAAGAAMLASGGTLMAMGAAGGAAASGIYTGYQIKNAVDNPPQMHRGNLAGNLAYNLNTKPTFLFYTKRTIRPENELDVIGYPSGHGGQISQFSGFLSASAVKLSSFNGTESEQNELLSILQGGIYL